MNTTGTMGSGAMFDGIARRYDLLNRVISLGLDRGWRRRLVESLIDSAGVEPKRVLDVATGTADVALAIARRFEGATVVGLDPSRNMLAEGAKKLGEHAIRLLLGDAQRMPFETAAFDATCISFGIRNVPDRSLGLREMVRVTRPGGSVSVLELSEPRGGLLSPFARFHVRHVVPTIGALLSGSREYRYLQRSVADFPPAAEFAELMTQAGLEGVSFQRLGFGAAHLYLGRVPAEASQQEE